MKASLKFREDQRPLARAKVPISILGLPFLSGVSAGDPSDLRLDLTTAFHSGPSLRLSYRPNESSAPFSLALKTGVGSLGSPLEAPMAITAEFNLLAAAGKGNPSSPAFSLLFKPRIGDFSIKRTAGSAAKTTTAVDRDLESERSIEGFTTPIGFKKTNGFIPAAGGPAAVGGIGGMLTGIEVTAQSVLPLKSRAAVRFKWGVRIPPELRAAVSDGGRVSAAGMTIGKLPLLVMSKISIEHVAAERKPAGDDVRGKGAAADDVAEACVAVKRELEGIKVENARLRSAVEELRSEISGWRALDPAAADASKGSAKGGRSSVGSDVSKGAPKPPASTGRRAEKKAPEVYGKVAAAAPAADDVSEELKRALMGATGGGN